jgi:hypothetical protein
VPLGEDREMREQGKNRGAIVLPVETGSADRSRNPLSAGPVRAGDQHRPGEGTLDVTGVEGVAFDDRAGVGVGVCEIDGALIGYGGENRWDICVNVNVNVGVGLGVGGSRCGFGFRNIC